MRAPEVVYARAVTGLAYSADSGVVFTLSLDGSVSCCTLVPATC